MIVERQTVVGKPGYRKELVEVLKEAWKFWDHPPTYRIYSPITGQSNVLYMDIEFGDFAEREEFWADGPSKPGWPAVMEKWNGLMVSGSTVEFVTLVE